MAGKKASKSKRSAANAPQATSSEPDESQQPSALSSSDRDYQTPSMSLANEKPPAAPSSMQANAKAPPRALKIDISISDELKCDLNSVCAENKALKAELEEIKNANRALRVAADDAHREELLRYKFELHHLRALAVSHDTYSIINLRNSILKSDLLERDDM